MYFLVWVFTGALYSNSSYPPPKKKAFMGTVTPEVRGGFHWDETSALPAFLSSLTCSGPRGSPRLEASPWRWGSPSPEPWRYRGALWALKDAVPWLALCSLRQRVPDRCFFLQASSGTNTRIYFMLYNISQQRGDHLRTFTWIFSRRCYKRYTL